MSAVCLCLRNVHSFLLVTLFLNMLPTKRFIYLFLQLLNYLFRKLNYYFGVTYLFLDFASSSSSFFLTSSHL